MKALFMTKVRGGCSSRSFSTNDLTLTIGLLIHAGTVLNKTMCVVSQYSGEYSTVADTVRRSTEILLAEENKLEAMLS